MELWDKKLLAQEIALQCLKLNTIGDARQDGKGPAVWFELAGHIGSITVRVIECGWIKNSSYDGDNDPDYNLSLYDFSDIEDYQNCLEYLKSLEVAQ